MEAPTLARMLANQKQIASAPRAHRVPRAVKPEELVRHQHHARDRRLHRVLTCAVHPQMQRVWGTSFKSR